MTNLGFHQAMQREGIEVLVTDVGDRYVVAEMLQGDYVLGGEQSGHIINRDVGTTGDGLATALLLLQALREMDVPLAEAAARDAAAAAEARERARARRATSWTARPRCGRRSTKRAAASAAAAACSCARRAPSRWCA